MKYTIGLPCYDFKVYSETLVSIFDGVESLKRDGHKLHQIICDNGNVYVSDARNKLVDRFMKTDAEALLFIDSDLAFDNHAMPSLFATSKALVGGVYPLKSDDGGYPLSVITEPDGKLARDGNYFKCNYLPTGLLKIHRSVFDKYRQKYPEEQGSHYFTYFENKLDKARNLWVGEDVWFCQRCVEMGEAIWCYPNIDFRHIGMREYAGNYYKYLQANAERGDK